MSSYGSNFELPRALAVLIQDEDLLRPVLRGRASPCGRLPAFLQFSQQRCRWLHGGPVGPMHGCFGLHWLTSLQQQWRDLRRMYVRFQR
jgi:hypothetical protein